MELWHELAGQGPPVVLIHEGICDARMWEPQWSAYAASHRVVRLDLRGFGQTPELPERFSHARDVIELLDRLALGPAALVGVSMGGRVALEVTVARPDLVSRLVLVAAGLSGLPGHTWSEEMERFDEAETAALERGDIDEAVEVNVRFWVDGPRRGPGDVDPDVRRRVAEMQRRAFELQLPNADAAVHEPLVPNLAERLSEVRVPTLVLVGAEDVSDMHVIADALAAGIPDARREEIAGTAHVPSIERPEEFDRLVLGFLDRSSPDPLSA